MWSWIKASFFLIFQWLQHDICQCWWLKRSPEGGVSLKDYKIYTENKNKRNENKIILGYFSCTMDKMGRGGRNKRQRLYRCGSNYVVSNGILDNGVEMGKGKPRFLWVHHYNGTLAQDWG